MNTVLLPSDYYLDDTAFDSIFPIRIQLVSKIHWTPIGVAKKAAKFLAPLPGTKILDIGSGIGKFCLVGANYFPDSEFYGIEQRKYLVDLAITAKEISDTKNAHFIHGNFTQLSLDNYDNIYFYNSFGENLINVAQIDDSLEYSPRLFNYYTTYLNKVLDKKPTGTRLVTFHGFENKIPDSYEMVDHYLDKALKMWIKK